MKTLTWPTAKQITDRYNITIEGNIPLTTRMLFGTQQDNMKYILDLVDSLVPQGNVPHEPDHLSRL